MSAAPLTDILRQLRFLEGVPEEELRQIASVARLEKYPEWAVLFREGERQSRVFLVIEGSVALELCVPNRGCKRMHTVGPGELLGWSPILSQMPMTATARALTPTQVVAIDAKQILALCHHDLRFGFELMRRTALALAQRLDATRLQLFDVYHHELPTVAGIHEGAD